MHDKSSCHFHLDIQGGEKKHVNTKIHNLQARDAQGLVPVIHEPIVIPDYQAWLVAAPQYYIINNNE